MEYLTRQQIDSLRALARAPRDRLLLDVLYETGCTVSELVAITAKDLGRHTIRVGGREAHVSTALLQRARAFLDSHGGNHLFPSRQKNAMTPKRVQQIVKKLLKTLDPTLDKTSPHLLRYTHIAHAVQQRIPFSDIQAQTGLGELRLSQIVSEVPVDHAGYQRWLR